LGSFEKNFVLQGYPNFSGTGILQGNIVGSNAVVSGVENIDDIMLYGTWTLAADNTMTINCNSTDWVWLKNLTLTNYGTVIWNSTYGANLNSASSVINNHGLWDNQANSSLSSATFNNYGTFRKSGGNNYDSPYNTTFDNTTTFQNFGTVD